MTHKNIQSLLDTQRLLLLDELEQCVELIATPARYCCSALVPRCAWQKTPT